MHSGCVSVRRKVAIIPDAHPRLAFVSDVILTHCLLVFSLWGHNVGIGRGWVRGAADQNEGTAVMVDWNALDTPADG